MSNRRPDSPIIRRPSLRNRPGLRQKIYCHSVMQVVNKLIIIFLFNLLILSQGRGQVTFSKLYPNENPSTTWGYSVLEDTGTYIVFGGGETFYGTDGFASSFLLETDSLGNQLKLTNVSTLDQDWYVGEPGILTMINAGGFVAGGELGSYDTLFPYNFKGQGSVIFYDKNGDTLFTRIIPGLGYTGFETSDYRNGVIYFIGATRDTSIFDYQMYVIAMDTLGNTLWEKRYGDGVHEEIGLTVDHFDNGNLLLGGGIEQPGTSLLTDGKIYKTDPGGNAYFSHTYGTPFDDGGSRVKVSRDQDAIFMQQTIDTTISEGDYQFVESMVKMDTNGNYIWRTFFNRPELVNLRNYHECGDGSIIICGVQFIQSSIWLEAFICKLDSNGNKLWERYYTTDSLHDAYFFDLQQTPDKGYIVSGSAVGPIDGYPNQQMWLVKLDSMGCLEPGCGDTLTAVPPSSFAAASLAVFPNPMHSEATVKVTIPPDMTIIPGATLELTLYDLSGRLADHYANIPVHNPGETLYFTLWRHALAPGLYAAVLRYGSQTLGTVKVAVE